VPEGFKQKPVEVDYDYALLKLKEKVPVEDFLPLCYDYHGLDINSATELQIWGYPTGNKKYEQGHFGVTKRINQYGFCHSDRLVAIREAKGALVHQISTCQGEGGAPILCGDKESRLVIAGIHKGSIITKMEG
jgi:V8-like Glu-specific endopeptidase